MTEHIHVEPSGCDEFDRARALLARGTSNDEALHQFEIACQVAADPAVRASAAAFAARLLLTQGKPWEAVVWADVCRAESGPVDAGSSDLADLLEASARLQLGEIAEARALLESVGTPTDQWLVCSQSAVRIVRAHATWREGDVDEAMREVLEAYASDPFSPDGWDAFACLAAETDFPVQPVVEQVPDDRSLEVLTALRGSTAPGVSKIAESIWARDPGDARVLALVPSFASRLDCMDAMEWSARLRGAGMGRTCPLLDRAAHPGVDTAERLRCAAIAHATFGDRRARELLERAAPALSDDQVVESLLEVWTLAPALADSVVVSAATTPPRAMRIASALQREGATQEAYAVLVHGLSMNAADELTTEDMLQFLSPDTLQGLAAVAEANGEDDVAGILEALLVVSVDG